MRTLKPIFGLFGAVGPILYCGGLLYYFIDVGGSVQEAKDIGLGPTLLGLAAVGLLFCIPLIVKIVGILINPRSSGSGGRGGPSATPPGGEGGFDADAAINRYMARQSSESASGASASPRTHESSGQARGSNFGRKNGG